ncbi:MAG: DUF4037 domain-containing protein [Planctomycetota bacterium]|jgi:hypothetical protein
MRDKQGKSRFIGGLELAEGFFREAVKPVLESCCPNLQYSAGLFGSGSEVLGFDDKMSVDHHWGPRVMLFLRPEDFEQRRELIWTTLSNRLPISYRDYSTNFSKPNLEDKGTQTLQQVSSGPVNHRVELFTIAGFFAEYMNIDIEQPLEAADWLTLPHQKLRSINDGGVFHDDLDLGAIRAGLSWYPHDVWLYLLAAGWMRIGQEEHSMGRAGLVGDEIGSALIGARLVRDIMRLAFLMEKEYPPYPKWLGTAFSRLQSASKLGPFLTDVLHSESWKVRETNLCQAYEYIADMHNALGITEPLVSKVSQFFGRPFKVIGGERIAEAIKKCIKDQGVKSISSKGLIGSVDMFSDNTDLLERESLRPALRSIYK